MIEEMNFWTQKRQKRIFLDYASITPVAREVAEAMRQYESGSFANPSALYAEAIAGKEAAQNARGKIARILNVRKNEIIFTASGTESNNLALLGVFKACRTKDFIPHIIVSEIEHPSILEICEEIKRLGGEVTYVLVSEEGIVNLKDIRTALRDNTVLISVMYANNEIGTIQPIKEIGRMIKEWRQKKDTLIPYFHTDACQAVLYESLDALKLGVDMMTLDGIKMHGPRGTGLLYMKQDVTINPIFFGGGQERGLRSGTENVPGIVGLAIALELAEKMKESELARLTDIRDYAIEKILKTFPGSTLNGSKDLRLPNNINICFPRLDAEFAVISLDVAGIAVSYSSSCRTLKEDSSSYVVTALGKEECGTSSLRITLGRESTKTDIGALVVALQKIIKK